jgi:ATP-dependent helicase/nuclease subunit B
MKKTLLIAPAGRGKTHRCIERYARVFEAAGGGLENRSFFILPTSEHARRITEMILNEIADRGRYPGIFNPHVMTINDFVQMHLPRAGTGVVSDIMRIFLLKQIAADPAVSTSYFRPEARSLKGFPYLLNDLIRELRTLCFESGDFERLVQGIDRKKFPLLRDKCGDLLLFQREYEKRLEREGKMDAADALVNFLKQQDFAEYKKRPFDLVIFDGFYHLSRAQLEFVKVISQVTRETVVTLTSGPGRPDVFSYADRMRQILAAPPFNFSAAAEALSPENKRISYAGKGKAKKYHSPSLDHLEKYLFSGEEPGKPVAPEDIRIFEATGAAGEMEMIAREIIRLREFPEEAGKEELNYTDFCVLFRSLSGAESVVRAVFKEFTIPVHVHERKTLRQNPLIKSIVHVLRFFVEEDCTEHLFECIGSRYFCFDRQGAASLKAFVQRRAVRTRDALYQLSGLSLDEEGRNILEHIQEFEKTVNADKTFAEMARRMFDWLAVLRHGSASGAEASTGRGDDLYDIGRDDASAFASLQEMVQRITQTHAGMTEKAAFAQFVKIALEGIDIALYSVSPVSRHAVHVYDIATAVQKEYQVVFVAGLLEKQFPRQIIEDPLLKDDERQLLDPAGRYFELRKDREDGERFLFYVAVTRASRKLYLSYPRFDSEGKESLPSFFVQEVERCFQKPGSAGQVIERKTRGVSDIVPAFTDIVRGRDVGLVAARTVFKDLDLVSREERGADIARAVYLARAYAASAGTDAFREAQKVEGLRVRLAGKEGKDAFLALVKPHMSASSLSLFAKCPYQFFARELLGLEDRVLGLDHRKIGTIFHAILEHIFSALAGRRLNECCSADDEAQMRLLVYRAVRRFHRTISGKSAAHGRSSRPDDEPVSWGGLFAGEDPVSARIAKRDIVDSIVRCLKNEFEYQAEMQNFVPAFFEKEFHITEGDLKIKGFIDRIDLSDGKHGKAAAVIDYKTGRKRFSLLELTDGVDLQIPIYIWAVKASHDLKEIAGYTVAAGLIYGLKELKRTGVYREDFIGLFTPSALPRKNRELYIGSDGLFDQYIDQARAHAVDVARRIQRCEIAPNPYPGYCPCEFRDICRYPFLWPNRKRWLKNKKPAGT